MTSPLDLIFSWQAILCATACVGITQLAKTSIDVAIGAEKRKRSRALSLFVLPMMPIWIGATYALLVPMAPDVLTQHLDAHEIDGWQRWLSLAAWGGACGQFSTYVYERVERTLKTGVGRA